MRSVLASLAAEAGKFLIADFRARVFRLIKDLEPHLIADLKAVPRTD